MAGSDQNHDLSTTKPCSISQSTSKTSSSSLLNRSMTTVNSSSFSKKGYVPTAVSTAASTIVNRNADSVKKWYDSANTSFKGKVKQLKNLFESQKSSTSRSIINNNNDSMQRSCIDEQCQKLKLRTAKSFSTDFKDSLSSWSILEASSIRFPGTEDRVVIYFTSLRGIRRTYEDCYAVRMIFRAFKVFVDERDVSMDAAYRKEVLGLLGEKNVSLPQVFVKGRYLGGVDLVKQLNETGELRKIVGMLPMKERRFVCDSCGDARFLPCSNCSGSRKLFDEDEGVMKRCLECNENGLIRCPECCL